jgi:LuxR family maltose regulon positive regulatory protein
MSLSAAIPRAPARLTVLPTTERPVFGPELVARSRLVRRLMDARDAPLAVLAAPAGYGKTTTLLDWAQHDQRPFAWVALGPDDNEPRRLHASIARSMEAVRRRGGPFVLVIDDVHVVRSRAATAALRALVAQPPAGAQVVLASRGAPSLRLGRLRAHRGVLELTTRDFVMTHGEAASLLERAGLRFDGADLDAIVQRTEGWPAGLYLAALSLADEPDPSAAIARFGGDDRDVADYLADTVLAELPDGVVAFLMRTSVLDKLSGPLCDAVLGETATAATLRDLARSNVLLESLDRTDSWYRYHGLFAQMLRAELRRRDPELEPQLRRRAAHWHAEHDDVDAAIRQAVAAADVDLAGELLWRNALHYTAHGRHAAVTRWLSAFTDETIAGSAPLALAAANACLARGERDLAQHWTGAAARALRSGRPEAAALEGGIATMRAGIAADGIAGMRTDAARARAVEPDDSPWRAVGCLLEGTASQLLGRRERAEVLLREGARRGLVAAPSVNALCLAQLAVLAFEAGERQDAIELAARARTQVDRSRLGDMPTLALVLAVSALGRSQVGQHEAARADAGAATRLLAMLDDFAPWYLAEVRVALARTMLALSDVGAARTLLDDAARALRATPDAPMLVAWLDDARTQVDAYAASAGADPASLTVAELRILRLLPTHLSFREMGKRLYVSPNTVKTQAQAVYRKLNASSRSQAVARGAELGLLDGPVEL